MNDRRYGEARAGQVNDRGYGGAPPRTTVTVQESDGEAERGAGLWRAESVETVASRFYAAVAPDSTVFNGVSEAASAASTAVPGAKLVKVC